jgi:hypothetical protein
MYSKPSHSFPPEKVVVLWKVELSTFPILPAPTISFNFFIVGDIPACNPTSVLTPFNFARFTISSACAPFTASGHSQKTFLPAFKAGMIAA